MDENSIREYARLMQELDLTGLEISQNGSTLHLERGHRPPAEAAAVRAEVPEKPARTASAEICSPMVGVFYAAPAENAPPFVQVGDRIRRGDVVCIIEAMKLMNEIVSDEDGVVAEICAENKQVVDFGTPLFRLRKEPE